MTSAVEGIYSVENREPREDPDKTGSLKGKPVSLSLTVLGDLDGLTHKPR